MGSFFLPDGVGDDHEPAGESVLSSSSSLPLPFATLCMFSRDSCFSHHLFPAAGPCLFRIRDPFNFVGG